MKLLIIEDEPITRYELSKAIADYGELIIASDGKEGLLKFQEERPDIVILDIRLPDIDGFSLFHDLQKYKNTPVIFITADQSAEYFIESIKIGADYFLRKPINNQVLRAVIDKTIKNSQELALHAKEAENADSRLRNIVSMLSEAVVISDEFGTIEFVNQYCLNLFGYKSEELVGQNVKVLTPPHIARNHDQYLSDYNKHRKARLIGNPRELEAQTKQGRQLIIDLNLSEFRDSERRCYLAIIRDVTEKREMQNKLQQAALYDSLTGLRTRVALNLELDQIIHTELHDGEILAFMIDIDDFQTLNAVLGHQVCDDLLVNIATEINMLSIEYGFSCFRVSGDRFVMFCFNADKQHLLELKSILIEQLLTVFEGLYSKTNHVFNVTGVGYTTPLSNQYDNSLTEQLELAILSARRQGNKGQIVKASELSYQLALQEASLKLELATFVDQSILDVVLQPKVNKNRQVSSFEALLRWHKTDKYPDLYLPDFIMAAEQSLAIIEIGYFVIDRVCEFLGSLLNQQRKRVSVNLSIRQLSAHDFIDKVLNCCKKHGVATKLLEFELTESMIADDINLVSAQLQSIRDAGFHIAVDDFGTGQSNLKYLSKLPISELKIDKSFVDEIKSATDKCPLVDSIYAIAKTLNLNVVAEGVETLEQVNYLRTLGVDEIQGYYFYRPMSMDACIQLLQRESNFTKA